MERGKASVPAGVTVTVMTPGERALRDDVAVVERVPRVVFAATGERTLGYLHDVLAQDVAELPPGRGAIAAALTANGRVAAEVRVLPDGDGALLDAEPGSRDGIVEQIARHAALAGIEVTDVSERFVLAALRGPATDRALEAVALPLPAPEDAAFARAGEVLVVRVGWGGPGADLLGPAAAVDAALARIDAERTTFEELDAARIEAGRPRFGVDVNADLLVNETPLLVHGVSMSKGCYPGQESVARIHNLGRIRRALRGLSSNGRLASGADVLLDGAAVGRVTSAAIGSRGQGVAIALLAAGIAPGTTVRIDGAEAVVEALS